MIVETESVQNETHTICLHVFLLCLNICGVKVSGLNIASWHQVFCIHFISSMSCASIESGLYDMESVYDILKIS